MGVYLAFVPPGGSTNPGGCTPGGVWFLNAVNVAPRDTATLVADPLWQCADPASVGGLSWTLVAIADAHADDFSSCGTIEEVLGGACQEALADDDEDPANDIETRTRPRVMTTGR
jgi:hypothetical protein